MAAKKKRRPPTPKRSTKVPVVANPAGNGASTYAPTQAIREKVKRLKVNGWSDQDIAEYLQITPPTLTKHFAHELRFAVIEKYDLAVELLEKAARKLNASAIKMLLERASGGGAPSRLLASNRLESIRKLREERLEKERKSREEKAAKLREYHAKKKLGKKEQEQQAALSPDQSTSMGSLLALRQSSRSPKDQLN